MVRTSRMTNVIMAVTLLWSTSQSTHLSAAPLILSDAPLVVSTSVSPNIIVLLDNSGSMTNIVPDTPYDATASQSCPASNALNNGIAYTDAEPNVDVSISSTGTPSFRYNNGSLISWGTSGTSRCFVPIRTYNARLVGDSGSPAQPGTYLDAAYTGHYLNWYFGSAPTNWGALAQRKPGTLQRIEIARAAGKQLVDVVSNVRMGLATYNGDNGASIKVGMADLTIAQKALMKTGIDALVPTGMTPLAESLQDIGRYFVQGFNNTLTLHPDEPARLTTKSAYTVFDHVPNYATGVSTPTTTTPVIQYFCQKNFAVLLTDGRPQGDQAISSTSGLQDYAGECPNGNDGVTCLDFGKKLPPRQYESLGSDYLDDVAMALFDMDLRPDLNDFDGKAVKNNIITYTIGFADEQAIHDPLLQSTATKGGGLFLVAQNAAQLNTAFQAAVTDIERKTSSTASVALNSGSQNINSRVYQARFNSGNWSGDLLSFPIDTKTGQIKTEEWNAGVEVTKQNYDTGRKILTFNPNTKAGIPFRWGSLYTSQQTLLNTPPAGGTTDTQGPARLDYLRGSAAQEGTGNNYRPRLKHLGDLVNSDPFYVGAPLFPDSLGTGYASFRTTYKTRTAMIYAGGNDGMLHGFDASNGSEKLAYVPNTVFANLSKLTSPDYGEQATIPHQYYVDGSPTVGDAYGNFGTSCPSTSPCWRSILVSGLRKGGQGLFALDVTDPTTFDESNAAKVVLWEFTNANDTDLGYSFSQPSIVKMANGRWAAVFGNGYNNTGTGHAVLYIVFLDGFSDGVWTAGTDFIKLDTGVGNLTTTPNGLATPAAVDVDGNFMVNLIYAGDLQGNMWRFNVSSSNPSDWSAIPPVQIFTGTATQPITSRPEVGPNPQGLPPGSVGVSGSAGVMVYFGTGKYLELTDITTTSTQTFYGLLDKLEQNPTLIARSALVAQTVLSESGGKRVTSNNLVDWNTKRGWYLDLPTSGERQVSDSILRNQRIIFTTAIPDTRKCSFGGTSWLMEFNALTGSRLETSPFDTNNDHKVNDADKISTNIGGQNQTVAVSGVQSTEGILPTPTILSSGATEIKYDSGSAGGIFTTTEDPGPWARGRLAWRQLQ